MLRDPPRDPKLIELMIDIKADTGRTLVDIWREELRSCLQNIAVEPTRPLQRRMLLHIVLQQNAWRSVYAASNGALRVKSWRHYVDAHQQFKGVSDSQAKHRIYSMYAKALVLQACLMEIGSKLYDIDQMKDMEIEFHLAYEKDIRVTDVSHHEMIGRLVDEHQDERARALYDFKSEVVTPIIKREFDVLDRLFDGIVNDNLDPHAIKESMDALRREREAIAEALIAPTT